MTRTNYITGFAKIRIDLSLLFRLHRVVARRYGFFRAFGLLAAYFRHSASLLRSAPNRYVKVNKDIVAVPDLPPVNSSLFVDSVVQDMEWLLKGKSPQMVFAIVCVTSRCPFSCPYCYNSNLHSQKERLEVGDLEKVVRELIHRGVKSIYLSGGEPMMRFDDVLHILNVFSKEPVRFWMLTTGWGMTTEKAAGLMRAGLKGVMVSLDSFDENRINEVKGSPRAFSDALNAIGIARKSGLIVAVDAVFGKSLLEKENFDAFVNTAENAGAQFINCYTPRQMHKELNDEYGQFNLEDFEKLGKRMNENHHAKRFKKSPICYSPDLWEAGRGCVGGKLFVYIDPEGNLKKCPFVEHPLGNIRTKSVNEILDGAASDIENSVCATNTMLLSIPMRSC